MAFNFGTPAGASVSAQWIALPNETGPQDPPLD
jgi:hypothetical protein